MRGAHEGGEARAGVRGEGGSGAVLAEAAVLHHKDVVGAINRGEAVGDS